MTNNEEKYINLDAASFSKVRVRNEPPDIEHGSFDFPWLEIEGRGIIDFDTLEDEILKRGYMHYEIMARDFTGRHNGHIREIPEAVLG